VTSISIRDRSLPPQSAVANSVAICGAISVWRYNKVSAYLMIMIQSATNLKLIDTLAQVILALSPEERQLLDQKICVPQPDLNTFFVELADLPPDVDQPSLEEISQVVREVRQELWAQR
jgi:hypothetical protein